MKTNAPPSDGKRLIVLVLLGFTIGFFGVALVYGQCHFLLSAYHHGGL